MKIRNEILLPVFVMALVLSGCEKPEPPAPDPELNMVSQTVQAVYEGGEYEIAYTLDNPVEGCEIEPVPEVDWIGGFDFSQEGKIAFTVEANFSKEQREGSIVVSYDYGDGLFQRGRVNVVQDGCPYDYIFNATKAFGSYYEGDGDYYTYLSDLGVDEEGYPLAGGTYYLFDIYVSTPYSGSGDVAAPEGTYVFSEDGDDYVSLDYSEWFKMDDSGSDYEVSGSYESGTLTISKDDSGNWVYRAELTDDEGRTHLVLYTGPVNLGI